MKNYSFFRALFTILFAALVTGTILITFSPGAEYIDQFVSTPNPDASYTGTNPQNGPQKIVGILPGHFGFDTGFQCGAEFNFVQENDVNLRLAIMVRDYLERLGYTVDLFHEYDPALNDYTGLALISIHAGTCDPNASQQSGFFITTGGKNVYPSESKRLNDCMTYHYAQNSQLDFLGENYAPGEEMFYAFDTVNDYTTISVIQTGFLGNDYRTISERTESLAKGIADGIVCYVENDTVGSIFSAQPVMTNLSVTSSTAQKTYIIPLSAAIAADN